MFAHRVLLLIAILFFAGCAAAPIEQPSMPAADVPPKYAALRSRLETFFVRMGKPQPGDWLSSFPENGQTFEEYIRSSPTTPTADRNTIYVKPLGEFASGELKAVKSAAGFLGVFYGLRVTVLPAENFRFPLSPSDQRVSSQTGKRQIRSGFILSEILKPALPDDAAALIAFTTEDLYPDESMNFIFGQASLVDRVGVWSLSRLKDKKPATFLERTLKVGVHETGHMFSIAHCTKYECVMSGSNHLPERDWLPLDACPECTAKICWMNDCDPASRFAKLAETARGFGLEKEGSSFEQKRLAVISD
ncbi:MAG: hypothetical protein IPN69_13485 [Acidobacteria bacterium]|nr:hypothetical protein [Acidobacteriota bacterium]